MGWIKEANKLGKYYMTYGEYRLYQNIVVKIYNFKDKTGKVVEMKEESENYVAINKQGDKIEDVLVNIFKKIRLQQYEIY